MDIIDFLDRCYIDYEIAPKDKREKIESGKLLIAFDKDKKQKLLIRISDLLDNETIKKLNSPLILGLLKGVIK